jgi:hypothetical protein
LKYGVDGDPQPLRLNKFVDQNNYEIFIMVLIRIFAKWTEGVGIFILSVLASSIQETSNARSPAHLRSPSDPDAVGRIPE